MVDQKKINVFRESWKKLLQEVGVHNPFEFPFELFELNSSIDGVTNFVVDPVTGNNSNRGDAAGPFATGAAALAALPKNISSSMSISIPGNSDESLLIGGYNITPANFTPVSLDIKLGTGPRGGLELANLSGAGTYRVTGTLTTVTPTTGEASGTAGAGTTTTSLAKPNATANWTANDFEGKFVWITGGAGAGPDPINQPVLRPLLGNGTVSIALDPPISGLNSTSTFAIVTPTTQVGYIASDDLTGIRVRNCTSAVELRALAWDSAAALELFVDSTDNKSVTLNGCLISGEAVETAIKMERNGYVKLENCRLVDDANIDLSDTDYVVITGLQALDAGSIEVSDARSCDFTKGVLDGSLGNALRMLRVFKATCEVDVKNATATPIYLESINDFTAVGTLITSSVPGLGYGIEIARAGKYTLTGCTIAGAGGDLNFLGRPILWTTLSNPGLGVVEEYSANAVAHSSQTKSLKYGNYVFDGGVDVSGRLLLYGYFNMSSNLVIPTIGLGDTLDMEAGTINGVWAGFGQVRGIMEVITTGNCTVILPSNAAIAGSVSGIINRGSGTITVTPPAGGTLNGGASLPQAANTSKLFISLNGAGGKDYWNLT